ncbi:MAG TPA: DUF5674 family protein [bacterium]|nr:DUF5674 family protein [bacterium]
MIKIIDQKISEAEVKEFLGQPFSEMIKFVADIRQEQLALGGQLHADGEKILLENGSRQEDLWGGNYYPANEKDKRIQYQSMINIRPGAGNFSMEVSNPGIREKMRALVEKLLA